MFIYKAISGRFVQAILVCIHIYCYFNIYLSQLTHTLSLNEAITHIV